MTATSGPPPSLQAFLDAFNAHDIDAIMSFSPTTACSTRLAEPRRGTAAQRQKQVPGMRRPRVHGCQIRRKDSFWKILI